jgi:PPOX class probable F420-dependent enzyme
MPEMNDLGGFAELVGGDHGLCVVSTVRDDGSVQSSVVNAGVLTHPVTGAETVAFVAAGNARKLANLRARPHATIVVRVGWQWKAADGGVDLMGPDDPAEAMGPDELRLLLRAIFSAAGGTHDDWDTFDRVMAEERRTAVLLTPRRVYGVP